MNQLKIEAFEISIDYALMEKADKTVLRSLGGLVGVCPYCGSPLRETCECGANKACTGEGCQYGSGQYPCKCRPAEPSGSKQVW